MGQRDREHNWGGERRGGYEGGRYGGSEGSRSGRGGRGGYRSSRIENYGDQAYDEYDLGSTYERSRGREQFGEYPGGREDNRDRGGYSSRDRDTDAFGGYGGRGGGYWNSSSESDYDRDRQRWGTENRSPYYGGGGLFGGGIGGYTGGGYTGGGFGGSAIDNESEEQRAYRRQNYSDRDRYENRRSRFPSSERGYYTDRGRNRDDRGWFDRVSDEVSSWFGGEDDDNRERSSYRGRGPRNYTRSDDRIKEDVNDRLTYDFAIDASDIDVEVNGGEVVLSGNVRSRYEKRLAEDIAEDVNGVGNVENRIRVNRSNTANADSSSFRTEGTTSTGIGTSGTAGSTTSAENTGTTTTGTTSRSRSAGSNR